MAKLKTFRVEFARVRVDFFSVLVDARTGWEAGDDIKRDREAIYKHFEPTGTEDNIITSRITLEKQNLSRKKGKGK